MKRSRNLRNVNLNLLPVLYELLQQRSVTEAARQLNLTQSAASASLKRLRQMFNDDLLVARGREMVLTEKAARLLPEVQGLMAAATAFFTETPFDPATSDGRFHVVTADSVTALLMPRLAGRLETAAPGVRVQVTHGTSTTDKNLRQGLIDLVIAPEAVAYRIPLDVYDADGDLDHEVCFEEPLVAIERLDGPWTDPDDLEAYLARPHAVFFYTSDLHASVEQETLAALGLEQNERIRIPEFTMLPVIVASSALVSVVPRSIAQAFSRLHPLRIYTPPVAFPPMRLIMVWARHRRQEEPLAWFRDQVRACFNDTPD